MEKKKLTIEQLRNMRESEDHVEFKRCQQGNLSFNGSDKQKPSDRRKCILGYVVALANAMVATSSWVWKMPFHTR